MNLVDVYNLSCSDYIFIHCEFSDIVFDSMHDLLHQEYDPSEYVVQSIEPLGHDALTIRVLPYNKTTEFLEEM